MTPKILETDYLVIGSGATGLAFTDALIEHCNARVVVVDRRHAPGGHWNDVYPFVRLHHPSAYYGVNSLALGGDNIDQHGLNRGLYERATGPEVCAYYSRVMHERLLGSGRVQYFPMCDSCTCWALGSVPPRRSEPAMPAESLARCAARLAARHADRQDRRRDREHADRSVS